MIQTLDDPVRLGISGLRRAMQRIYASTRSNQRWVIVAIEDFQTGIRTQNVFDRSNGRLCGLIRYWLRPNRFGTEVIVR